MSSNKNLKNYLMNKREDNKNKSKEKFNPNINIKNLMEILDYEKKNQIYKTWNKLEKSIKQDRIIKYLDQQSEIYNMSSNQYNLNKSFLFKLFDEGQLNKLSDVGYNCEDGLIVSFNRIIFDKKTKLYSM